MKLRVPRIRGFLLLPWAQSRICWKTHFRVPGMCCLAFSAMSLVG